MTWRHVAILVALCAGCGGGGGGGPAPVVFQVTAILPRSSAQDVPLSEDVVVSFSKRVDPDTLTPDSFKVVAESGDEIPGMRSVAPVVPTQIRFTPVVNYFPFANHTVVVTRDIRDDQGAALDKEYSFVFRTEEDGPVLPTQAQVETKGSLRTGRFLHRMTAIGGAGFLVTGGYVVDGQNALATAETISLVTEQSQLVAGGLGGPRAAHVQVTLQDGRILLAGGEQSSTPFVPLATAEVFDPATATPAFQAISPMHFARSFAHATVLQDGRVLVTGGQGLASDATTLIFRDDAEIYDPVTDSWMLLGSRMEAGRASHMSALTPAGDAIVIGGTPGLPSATFWRRASGFFSAPADPPFFDHFFAASTVLPDGRPFVASGVGSLGVTIWDSRYGFIGATNQLPAERSFATATAFADGRVLIVGGFDLSAFPPTIQDTVDIFYPIGATGRIIRLTDLRLPQPLSHQAAALGADGKIWVSGGFDSIGGGVRRVFAVRPQP
jgi:hypothetical protein